MQAAVKGYLEARGAFVVRVNSGAFKNGEGRLYRFNGQRGCSDLLGVLADGTAFAIEVKRPGHRTAAKRAAEQKAFILQFARRGAVAGVVESVEDVMKLLEGR